MEGHRAAVRHNKRTWEHERTHMRSQHPASPAGPGARTVSQPAPLRMLSNASSHAHACIHRRALPTIDAKRKRELYLESAPGLVIGLLGRSLWPALRTRTGGLSHMHPWR